MSISHLLRGPFRTRGRAGPAFPWLLAALAMAGIGGAPTAAVADADPKPQLGGAADRQRESGFGVRGHRPVGASIHRASGGRRSSTPAQTPEATALAAHEAELAKRRPKSATGWPERWHRPDLPIRWNERTAEYLRYFQQSPSGRRLIRGWFQRAANYLPELKAQLTAAGLPADLAFVAMVESGLNPTRVSRTGAAGLWQFMPATGAAYGLARSHWIDERFDAPASTVAATALLADLQSRFGSWELALAAYHAGFARVLTAMRRANTNDFWTIARMESGLPLHSLNYPTKVLALAIVSLHPKQFGLDDLDLPTPGGAAPATRYVEVPAKNRLARLAKRLGVDPERFLELNAKFYRGRTPPSPRRIRVRVPAPAAQQTAPSAERAAITPPPAEQLATYEVRLGESLEEIAERVGVTPGQLRRINGILDSGELRPETVLLVPEQLAQPTVSATPQLVAVPAVVHPKGRQRVFFRVNRASSMRALLARLPVTWHELVRWNGLDPAARPFDGQWLQLFVPKHFNAESAGVRVWQAPQLSLVERSSPAHVQALVKERQLRRRSYTVRARDTWRRLERRFGLSRGSIARINRIERSRDLVPGSQLLLYLEPGRTRGTGPAEAATAHEPWLAELHRPSLDDESFQALDCTDAASRP